MNRTVHFSELDTPALLIDLERMEANIERMAELAKSRGVELRPHTKTHKCPDLAKLQLQSGACGITCAKIGEAEVMAAAGIDDILIANEIIGKPKYQRLLELSKMATVCVAVDSAFGAQELSRAFAEAGQEIDVVIEINCGQNRAGLLPGEPALQLAGEILALPSLRLRGLMTHGGHAYNQTSEAAIKQIGLEEGRVMVETAELFRKNAIPVQTVSVGSTPTARHCSSVEGVTEMRPGTYIFYDCTEIELFACTLQDCALSVLATVISRPADDRVILDAGKKALTSDPSGRTGQQSGYGFIPGKNAVISRLSEEHGVLETAAKFEIGEKVRIVPNHACVVVNMFDQMYGIRNEVIERVFKIEGRGKML